MSILEELEKKVREDVRSAGLCQSKEDLADTARRSFKLACWNANKALDGQKDQYFYKIMNANASCLKNPEIKATVFETEEDPVDVASYAKAESIVIEATLDGKAI